MSMAIILITEFFFFLNQFLLGVSAGILSTKTFSVMVVMCLVTTFLVRYILILLIQLSHIIVFLSYLIPVYSLTSMLNGTAHILTHTSHSDTTSHNVVPIFILIYILTLTNNTSNVVSFSFM